ncbi:flavin reductase family protein [Leifsonia kafniensis]|uniref:flavin reductase family protein n=1 Tax=Leifsonia kafniensis TaxID=475957 RepID=UPI0031F057AF
MPTSATSPHPSLQSIEELAAEEHRATADEFKAAFRNHPAGVAVITADSGTGPVALTATSVFSISVDPPLLVFSLSDLSSAAPAIRAAETVVVHLLGEPHLALAQLCATSGVDRFADPAMWTRLETGEPCFTMANSWIRGQVVERLAAGSSTVIVVRALQVAAPQPDSPLAAAEVAKPLVYHNRVWHSLGDHSAL